MEVILLSDIEKLGREGDQVKVADGYARNFLLPRKLALRCTKANQQVVEAIFKKREARLQQELEDAQAFAEKLKEVSCTIQVKVGEEDKLYGSVTSQDIAEVLEKEGYQIDKRKINLEEPIKKLGVYTVDIHLHAEVDTQVKVWVVKE